MATRAWGRLIAMGLLAWGAGGAPPLEAQVPWNGTWRVEAAEARPVRHQGREALLLQNGAAWLETAALQDGAIRFDLNASGDLGFYGIAFRAVDDANYEHVYVRPFMSGNPDATQYTPVFGGVSGWQIYSDERFARAVDVPTDRWVHVEVRFRDGWAELHVEGEPVVFPALQRERLAGAVGITASGAPAFFANVAVSHQPPAAEYGDGDNPQATDPGPLAEGLVEPWVVSTPFAEDALSAAGALPQSLVDGLEWTRVAPDVRGIVDLARSRMRSPAANTVLAGVTLRSDADRSVRLRFGFSDRVTVYLDGRPLYRGASEWRSRDYRFLGTVGLFDELILPLHEGDNLLRFAVSEDFGGWGVVAQVLDSQGVEVLAR